MLGKEGVGKSIIMDFLKRHVFGEALYYEFAGLSTLTKKFNKFLANRLFVCINESASVDTSHKDALALFELLKQLITGDFIQIEPKGVDAYLIRSFISTILFSNNFMPIWLNNKEARRYGVFEACGEIPSDAYFNYLEVYLLMKWVTISTLLPDCYLITSVLSLGSLLELKPKKILLKLLNLKVLSSLMKFSVVKLM